MKGFGKGKAKATYMPYKWMHVRIGKGDGYIVSFEMGKGLSSEDNKKKHYDIIYDDAHENMRVSFYRGFLGEDIRKAVGVCVSHARRNKKAISFVMPKFLSKYTKEVVEGALLSNFSFDVLKSSKEQDVQIYLDGKVDKDGLKRGIVYANAQNLVRWMDEYPSNVMKPEDIVSTIKSYAKKYGWKVRVYNRKKLESMGMGGIINVGKGSSNVEPTLIHIERSPRIKSRAKIKHIALVGKGVMFDAGGISLKPSKGMGDMKYDKTGALVVFGTLVAVSELDLPVKLTVLMPLVENLPSGSAQRPADVITVYNGKTVEVANTDAEGRLILADAISFAVEKKPDVIVDVATLTGAILIALGTFVIGMFGTDERFKKALVKAGNETYERVWEFPVWEDYAKMIESNVADIKNIGSEKGYAGSITAAMFLKFFAGDLPWVHLDIAGVMYNQEPGEYLKTGATGVGVRLLTSAIAKFIK